MLKIIFCTLTFIFSFNLLICKAENANSSPTEYLQATLFNMRCTRRFTPGICVDVVAPVWTFVFMAQNCTERLGCPGNFRSNRFRSYQICMKHCRILIEKYLDLVQLENVKNATRPNDEAENSDEEDQKNDNPDADDRNLREGLAKYFETQVGSFKDKTENYEDVEEGDYHTAHQDPRYVVYKDINVNEEIMPPDVDYIAGEIRSGFDLQRW
ncbi:hypothetical protein HF086_006289 [Spodoptera exigua]|uniref:BPTI/Kunitz inhibitor domain-containing protein n=1 Tax=Spodoptera exigua TaxID=7107 RepID=A0A922M311_SPOEX|nr:hypothetical protein HF086_006289 [Spodoptera exigua]